MDRSEQDVIDQVLAWRSEGRKVALATVIATWGSSPRPVGSQLAVDEAGQMVGSVSGGCIEGAVVKEAQEIMAGAKPRLLDFGITNEQAWEVGLACGGKLQVYVEAIRRSRSRSTRRPSISARSAAGRPTERG
jgi:xanthine/CO dehydrogenase XdhC/CoxF family maturation factor